MGEGVWKVNNVVYPPQWDPESTDRPHRTCTGAPPLAGPLWQQSCSGCKKTNVQSSQHWVPTRVTLCVPWAVPSVEGDFGGPVVKRAWHKDFFSAPCPSEDGRASLRWTLAVALQVLLPGQELLDLLRSLDRTVGVAVSLQRFTQPMFLGVYRHLLYCSV